MKAKIAEIFESIQGEGIYQGLPQAFIRFFGCNLKCRFCDTPLSKYTQMDIAQVWEKLEKFSSFRQCISFTGGEPLLQKDFLKAFLPEVKAKGIKTYLETNGTLYEELSEIIDYLDIIAMDFKLPTSTGQKALWDGHENFLRIASRKEVFVKAVIGSSTKKEDLCSAINLIRKFNKEIPFVLQPQYQNLGDNGLSGKLEEFKALAQGYLRNVSIVGQLHKITGVK